MRLTIGHLVWREVLHRLPSFVLAALLVGASCATVVGVLGILGRHARDSRRILVERERSMQEQLAAYDDSLRRSMQHLGFNILLIPAEQNLADFYSDDYASATMSADVVDALRSSELMTVEHIVPRLRQKLLWPERSWTIQVVGTGGDIVNPSEDARELRAVSPPVGHVDVGYELHHGLDIEPGDSVRICGAAFTVRNCVPESGNADDITVWMSLADAQQVLGEPGRINEVLALECRTSWLDLPRVRAEIGQVLPGVRVIEKRSETLAKSHARETMAREGEAMLARERAHRASVLAGERRLGALIAAVVVCVSAFWVGVMTVLNVRGRRMEIGILRANGFGRDGIAALFASRSLFASCVGAVAGFAAGLLFVGFPGLWWSVCWFMVCLSVALAIALVAGVLPALRALSVDPAAVLQSEY